MLKRVVKDSIPNHHMTTRALPNDVLHLVFDHVEFEDLFRFTHVSHTWRATGVRHPKYWRWLALGDDASNPGGVSLFLQRLNMRNDTHSTFFLQLTLSSLREDLASVLLPALRTHIRRAKRVTLALSSAIFTRFGSLFACSAPLLRQLCLIVTSLETPLSPFLTMFNLHTQTCLENVTLIDVPLHPELPPLTQPMKTLTVYCFEDRAALHQALCWIPRPEMVVVTSPKAIPSASALQTVPSLRYLSLLCENWSPMVRALATPSQLACLSIGVRYPEPLAAAELIPRCDELCVCIKTQLPADRRFSTAQWGVVVVATPDRSALRLFHHFDISYMVSGLFLDRFIPSERIVQLVVSLTCGFTDMCGRKFTLPRLDTLCLGIDAISRYLAEGHGGALRCPVLRIVAFQAEKEGQTPRIPTQLVESFVETALIRTSARLHIVLKDVALEGPWSPAATAITVSSRSPRVHWLHDSGMDWADDVPLRSDWMDVE
ncbi:hypothetical protein AURDEDRAFT_126034 [Auricularia subglabra TFB-10046 SS5]|nr:hypothetical protein AURDEDRAFT_126034 [Auricularia subglabra TFB-10046 SS5]